MVTRAEINPSAIVRVGVSDNGEQLTIREVGQNWAGATSAGHPDR